MSTSAACGARLGYSGNSQLDFCHESLRLRACESVAVRASDPLALCRAHAGGFLLKASDQLCPHALPRLPRIRGFHKRSASQAAELDHPLLRAALQPHLALQYAVTRCAKRHVREGATREERAQLEPGGEFDGQLLGFAMLASTLRLSRINEIVLLRKRAACHSVLRERAPLRRARRVSGRSEATIAGGGRGRTVGGGAAGAVAVRGVHLSWEQVPLEHDPSQRIRFVSAKCFIEPAPRATYQSVIHYYWSR